MKSIWLLTSIIVSSATSILVAQFETPEPPTANKSQEYWATPITPHRAVITDKLEPIECGTVKRIHQFASVFLASQPQPGDFREAQKHGIKTVINLRFADELDWNEAKVVNELGLEYHNVPFSAPETLTDDVFSTVSALLNAKDKHPVLLHCSSSNRVGAIWLAHRVLDDGLTVEAAEAEARTAGLKLAAYAAIAKGYVQHEQKKRKAIAVA